MALGTAAHDFGYRPSMEAYEAHLKASAFTRMINLLKIENKLRSGLDSCMKKTFELQQVRIILCSLSKRVAKHCLFSLN